MAEDSSKQCVSPVRGRGRGYGLDNSPLRKPDTTPRRPGSANSQQSPSGTPKSTHSESSVNLSTGNTTSLNAGAAEFIPRSTKSNPEMLSASIQQETDHMDKLILFIENSLNDLLLMPSAFDRVVNELVKYLESHLRNESCMITATDVVFEWAVIQDNFSYTCARIVLVMQEQLTVKHNGSYHAHMMKRCHHEHKEHKQLAETDPRRLINFSIFMAELYTKIFTNKVRSKNLRCAVIELIDTMLAHKDNNVFSKTIVQVLKMCGACLEDDLSDKSELDKILEKLASNATKVDESLSRMLKSVITLRQSNWGRSDEEEATMKQSSAPSYNIRSQTQSDNQTYADDYPEDTQSSDYGGGDYLDYVEQEDMYDIYDDTEQVDIVVVDDDNDDNEHGMTDEMFDDFEKFSVDH